MDVTCVGKLSIERLPPSEWYLTVYTSDNSRMGLPAESLDDAIRIATIYVRAGKDVRIEEHRT